MRGKKLSVFLLVFSLALSAWAQSSPPSGLAEAKEIIKAQSQMIDKLTTALENRDKQLTAKDQQLNKVSELLAVTLTENETIKSEQTIQQNFWLNQQLYVQGLENSLKAKETENTILYIVSGALLGGLSLDLIFRR